jgi:hypothetical protein
MSSSQDRKIEGTLSCRGGVYEFTSGTYTKTIRSRELNEDILPYLQADNASCSVKITVDRDDKLISVFMTSPDGEY